jgi:hypothetical protein
VKTKRNSNIVIYCSFSLTIDSDLNTALTDLSKEDRKDECIKHALHVRSAWALSNYHKFFQLYLNAPKMAGYLMDKFVGRVRKSALKAAIKAYVSNIGIYFDVNYNFIFNDFNFSDSKVRWLCRINDNQIFLSYCRDRTCFLWKQMSLLFFPYIF